MAGGDREAGDAAGARDQFAVLLPVRGRVLCAEHPDTARTAVVHAQQHARRWQVGAMAGPCGQLVS
jgi:hypothetical protein